MEVGKRIKMLRTNAKLTQDELGEKLGVKKAAIQKYENGLIVNLKVDTIKKLAEIFDVTPAYIMGWDKFDEEINLSQIQKEIALVEIVDELFDDKQKELVEKTFQLNEEGQNKLFSYINDLIQINKYSSR